MRKFIFKSIDIDIVEGFPVNQAIEIIFEAETLPELIEAYRSFLLANGYSETRVTEYLGSL